MAHKSKSAPIKVRSRVAQAAWNQPGAGTMRSDYRCKPRATARREAIRLAS